MSTGEIFRRVVELLIFHSVDRKVYYRLVWGLRQERTNARRCLALWKWLESIGHDNVVLEASFYPDGFLFALYNEALICYNAVMGLPPPDMYFLIPLTAGLIAEPIDLGFFFFHRDLIKQGFDHITDTVCNAIFDDNLQLIIYDGGENSSPTAYIYPTVGWMDQYRASLLPVVNGADGRRGEVKFTLPNAGTLFLRAFEEIDRRLEPESERANRRSAFIVFLRDNPIGRGQIIEYFTSRFGNCLERVAIEQWVGWGRMAVHGRIVFVSLRKMLTAMKGKVWALYQIQGNFLWARMYTQPQGYGVTEDEHPGRWI